MWMAWLLLLIITLVLVFYLLSRKTQQRFEPSKTNINNTIDNSNFFARMSNIDLTARGASSIEEYKETYKKAITIFSDAENNNLRQLVTKASLLLNSYDKISRIPWKIVKSSGVEAGMPHTIGDIIVLPSGFFDDPFEKQLEVLIHEKLHVYQRIYPIETSRLLVSIGFKHWKQGKHIPMLRNNPDNDSSVYSFEGVSQAQIYTSKQPGSIKESELKTLIGQGSWNLPVPQKEHPYEIMACWISLEVIGRGPESTYRNKIRSWMKEFL